MRESSRVNLTARPAASSLKRLAILPRYDRTQEGVRTQSNTPRKPLPEGIARGSSLNTLGTQYGGSGVIVQELSVRGDKGGKKLPVVFDSSASRSLVRSESRRGALHPEKAAHPEGVRGGRRGQGWQRVSLRPSSRDRGKEIEAFPVDRLPVPLIFEALDMEAYRIKLDLSEFTGRMLAL